MHQNQAPTDQMALSSEQQAFSVGSGRKLLRLSGVVLSIGALLVTFCYFAVDKPVAFFVHERHLDRFAILEWLTYIPMVFNALAPLVVVCTVVKLAWAPLSRRDWTLLAASISLMVAICFEYYSKYLFGRYWPETWVDDNASLIGNGAYGFHPFHFGSAYGSFPSGHTARAVAVLSVFWIACPAWRIVCVVVGGSVIVALVGMNYHFVGDTVGGTMLGALTGLYTSWFCKVGRPAERPG